MNDLFGTDASQQTAEPPHEFTLAMSDVEFRKVVAKLGGAHKIFTRGLPDTMAGLVALAGELCRRLRAVGEGTISGKRLAADLGLVNARALRQLVAFIRVAWGLQEIVGIPGHGYCWGPADPDVYARLARHAQRMGRDWLYIAALYGEGDADFNVAQMMLEFASTAHQRTALGLGDGAGDAGLADLAERKGVSLGGLIDRMLEFMSAHPQVYGKDLERVGRKHAKALVSAEILADVAADADRLAARVRAMAAG